MTIDTQARHGGEDYDKIKFINGNTKCNTVVFL
jgi:hypothetical protein